MLRYNLNLSDRWFSCPTITKTLTLFVAISVLKVDVLLSVRLRAKCPALDYSWCSQIDGYDSIILDGNRFPDVKPDLKNISNLLDETKGNKTFHQFWLQNDSNVRKLEANTFADLTFTSIKITNCTKLIRIDPNTFNGTQHSIIKVHINLISISGPKNVEDFFEALNDLSKLEELVLLNHNIITIPPFAFRLPLLRRLELDGPIDVIKNNAFFDLNSLTALRLTKSVKHIPKHSFDFKTQSNQTLDIDFNIRFNTIETGVFRHVFRPIHLNLYLRKLRDFNKSVFKDILMSDRKHNITFHGELKEMGNKCILHWLFSEKAIFNGRISFQTDPVIGVRDFMNCPLDDNTNDSQVNSIVSSRPPVNSIPNSKVIDKYVILFVGSLYLYLT